MARGGREPAAAASTSTSSGATRAELLATVALALMAAATVIATFGPWLRTGSAQRTSHAVVRAADRLGVLEPGWQRFVSVTWAFVPLVAVVAVAASVTRRHRTAAVLGLAVGLAVVALARTVMNAPGRADWGATGGFVAAVALSLVAIATPWITRSSR